MTRSVNRRKWDQSELQQLIDNPASETGRVFKLYARLLELRRQQEAFHPDARQRLLDLGDSLFGFERTSTDGAQHILALANLTARRVALGLERLPTDLRGREELLAFSKLEFSQDALILEPFAVFWFSQRT